MSSLLSKKKKRSRQVSFINHHFHPLLPIHLSKKKYLGHSCDVLKGKKREKLVQKMRRHLRQRTNSTGEEKIEKHNDRRNVKMLHVTVVGVGSVAGTTGRSSGIHKLSFRFGFICFVAQSLSSYLDLRVHVSVGREITEIYICFCLSL